VSGSLLEKISIVPIYISRVRSHIRTIACSSLIMKPVMALVTYILLAALQSGLDRRFHPRILGDSASKGLAVVVLDFFFVKIGCYFLNVQGTGQVVDLIAYGGYKFVG
jgi:protein transport protein YIF1